MSEPNDSTLAPLGDRIRARRKQRTAAVEGVARTGRKHLRSAVQRYIDVVETRVKAYVDERIAKLCDDNDLTPP